jgi:cytidylate kinase
VSLVAISASYGAGGSVIGRALAQRLGVPFVDRAIPVQVAERLDVTPQEAAELEQPSPGGWLERMLRGFIATDASVPTALPPQTITSEDFRRATEEVLHMQAATGAGVILGRAAVIVLRQDPRVLRVRLHGPRDARIAQAMALSGIDAATAERALDQLDRTHEDYARRYGADLSDPSLYDVALDATRFDVRACVDLLAAAASRIAAIRQGRGA